MQIIVINQKRDNTCQVFHPYCNLEEKKSL